MLRGVLLGAKWSWYFLLISRTISLLLGLFCLQTLCQRWYNQLRLLLKMSKKWRLSSNKKERSYAKTPLHESAFSQYSIILLSFWGGREIPFCSFENLKVNFPGDRAIGLSDPISVFAARISILRGRARGESELARIEASRLTKTWRTEVAVVYWAYLK